MPRHQTAYVKRIANHVYLGAFGSTPSADLARFSADYFTLRSQILLANSRSADPVASTTLTNNLERMDNVYRAVMAGEYDRGPALVNTARAILAAVGQTTPSTTLETLLRSLQEIPAQLQRAVVAAARTAGEASRELGIDPEKIIDEAGSGLRAVGVGVGLAAVAILAFKFL